MSELKENQLVFVDENQNEVLCDILFTYESEEFGKLCAQDGLTAAMIKKYIINTSPSQHFENLNKKHPIAIFIEKNSLTKQCFDWRHQLSSVNVETEEDYM